MFFIIKGSIEFNDNIPWNTRVSKGIKGMKHHASFLFENFTVF